MKKTLLLTILTLILIIPLTTATGEYYNPAYDTKTSEGQFSSATTEDYNYQSLTNDPSWFTPLVGDLDADGTNEIIVIDGDNVEIYQTNELTPISGKSAEDSIQHAILHDIYGNGNLSVLTVGGDKFSIFSWNGTSLNLDTNHTIAYSTGATTYQYMIGCGETEECILVNARFKSGVPSIESVYVMKANSTGVYNPIDIRESTNNGDFSLPKIRTVSYGDMTGIGDHYVFSAFDHGYGKACYWYITLNSGSTVETFEKCIAVVWSDFTSPLIGNFDPTEAGLEVVIAYQADSIAEFEMILYDSGGVELADYPELTFTEGNLISNPVRTQVFDDTSGYRDFCVAGYDTSANEINLLCGSPTHSEFLTGEEFTLINVSFDLQEDDYYPTTLIHALQTDSSTTGGVNLNEYLTSFGLIGVNYNSNSLYRIFDITEVDQGIAVPSDVEQTGYFDILYHNDIGIFYFDDGYINEQVVITSHGIDTGNPICEDVSVKLNVTFTDDSVDTVTCWYEELEYNESSKYNSTNQSRVGSGTFNFYYSANEVGTFFIDFYCTDGLHDTLETERRQVQVSNESDVCNMKGDGAETTTLITPVSEEDEAADEEFDSDVDAFFDGMHLTSPKARNILAMCIVIGMSVLVFVKSRSVELSLGGGIAGALIALIIGVMSILPFVIIIITSIALLVRATLKNNG